MAETEKEKINDSIIRVKWTRNLEDVESLKLNVATFLLQHVHHELEVVGAADVASHDREVVTIQQQLAQQLHMHTKIGIQTGMIWYS